MTEPQSHDPGPAEPLGGQAGPPATPRWVKIAGAVVALAVLAVLAKVLLGGGAGGHGPSMHGGLGGTAAPAGVALAGPVAGR